MPITQALGQIFRASTPVYTRIQLFLREHSSIRSGIQLRLFRSFRPQLATARNSREPAPQQSKQLRNENIHANVVQVVNDDGRLGPPQHLQDVLESLDRSKFSLIQVSPGQPHKPPVCKIVNKVALQEQERVKAKAAHSLKTSVKQLEMNWAITAHDLSHRLKQLTAFLDKGRKVEITLTRKKGKRPPTVEEVKQVMDSVMQAMKEANAMLVKPIEGEPGKHVLIIAKQKDT